MDVCKKKYKKQLIIFKNHSIVSWMPTQQKKILYFSCNIVLYFIIIIIVLNFMFIMDSIFRCRWCDVKTFTLIVRVKHTRHISFHNTISTLNVLTWRLVFIILLHSRIKRWIKMAKILFINATSRTGVHHHQAHFLSYTVVVVHKRKAIIIIII